MSYQALYRKYRPSSLSDVVGQDIVIQILKNAIKNNKVCHAYIFSGPRGIGKTSIAKLLAKAVNCLDLDDGDACGKCENCVSISSGFSSDIIEIDAASNNGVDEIREIKSKINLVPNQLKYKVYIIDEVHMLSIGAFNALLKTLEEPPEHVIFILATTDLYKVPTTIIYRCQFFEFKRICEADIVKRLKHICNSENISIDDSVLECISRLSDGGLRDAIGMLDKLNAYSNGNITIEDFEKVNGIVSKEYKNNFLNYVSNGNVSEAIKFIDYIYDNGKDLIIFVQDMLNLCKDYSISYYIDNEQKYDIKFLIEFSKVLNDLSNTIKTVSDVKTILIVSILSFMGDRNVEKIKNVAIKNDLNIKNNEINDNNYQLKQENAHEIISREIISNDSAVDDINYKEINQLIINNCFARASKNNKEYFESKWNVLNDYALDSEFGAAACYVSDGVVRAVGDNEVIISFDYESMVSRGFGLINKIQILFEKIYNKHFDIALVTNDEWNIEKEKYIANKKNNVAYKYIPIDKNNIESEKKEIDNKSIASQAIDLFGEDLITIN